MKFYYNFCIDPRARIQKFRTKLSSVFSFENPELKKQIIMRINLIFAISLMVIMQVSANSFGQRININEKNASLATVLKTIRIQSGYDVLFDAKLVQKASNIDIFLKDATLEEALEKCLSAFNLTYKLEEHTVIIKEKSFIDKVIDQISFSVAANEIKGYIFTSKGREPMGGASITVKRTKKSVYSDNRGYFLIKDVLPTDSLQVSYIGYITQVVAVNGKDAVYISLEEAVNALDVMVVQGYGKTTQRLATGNITRVGASEIGKQLIDNPVLALQGSVPGLEITSLDGRAFSNQRIELRGRKSINGNLSSEPLIILDGVPQTVLNQLPNTPGNTIQSVVSSGLQVSGTMSVLSFSPLYNINPSDIESIEVLKDADATAIYGSRAGNGVILITTKKGKSGKTNFNVKADQGIRSVIEKWDLLNTEQYLEMRKEAFSNDKIIPTANNAPELKLYDQNRYTDWQEMSYGKTGRWSTVDANISGGDAQTRFRIAATFNDNTDITSYSGVNQRLSTRMGLSHVTQNKKLKFDVNAGYSATKNTMINFRSAHLVAPNAPAVFKEDGSLNFEEWKSPMNEFSGLLHETEAKGNALNVSSQIVYSPITNLDFGVRVGYNANNLDTRMTIPLSSYNPLLTNPTPSILLGITKVGNILVEPEMNYNVILGKGKLSVLVGASYQDNNTKRNSVNATGFTSDQQMGSINAATRYVAMENLQMYRYAGVFARLNYNWQNKYILNLNGRRDGSSRFGEDYRFGNFGAVGATWILSEENFVKSALPKFISFVKLRGSIGVVGSDGIGDYKYLTQWGLIQNGERLPVYDNVSPVVPQLQPNSEFRWQRNIKSEGAISLAFFKETIGLDFSYYSEYTNNQLLSFPTPLYTGFSSLIFNSPAEVQNRGIEVALSASIVNRKNFSWNTNFNFYRNRNKLTNYPGFEDSPYYSTYKIGQPLSNVYVFQGIGVNPQTGEYEYLDADKVGGAILKSGVPAGTNGDDRIVAINTSPDFSGGMTHSFRYKSFGLSANFYYTKKKGAYSPRTSINNTNMTTDDYNNFWHKPGDQAKYSKLTSLNKLSNTYFSASTLAYLDLDFIRLNNIQFSYSLPQRGLKALGLSNLSINATAQNIFVISKFKGQDPEIISNTGLPQTRTITMGLNCTF